MVDEVQDAPVESDISTEALSTEIGSTEEVESSPVDSGSEAELTQEQTAELTQEVQDAVDEGATQEEIKELIETFNIKVNGKEKEVTLDWNNKEDIIRRLQLAEAGQSAMHKSAELEKRFESTVQELMNDPWAMLEELGIDPDELAEARIAQTIEQLQKSPEQLEREARDAELEELRRKLKEQEEEREGLEFQRLQREAEEDLDNQITDALSSTTELPKSPYVVKRIADAMLTAMENGQEDITAKDVVPWVEKEINQEIQDLFSAMPDKLLEQYLGNQTIDRLRQSRLSKMNTQPVKSIKETGKKAPVEKVSKRSKIKLNDWLKHGNSLTDLE